jgi:UDP-2,3-diacylglucosamine hydrolase
MSEPGSAGSPGSAGPGPVPAYFELSAPPKWRAIDFVSDLHLSAAMPRTFAALAAHLKHTTADAVFILGDLFELWVGDDTRSRPFERQCVDLLAEAASHRMLAFMQGNRDFLVGAAMLRACGMTGLPDPTLFNAWGQKVLLSHGDALCVADKPYQAFRTQVRSPEWQRQFLAKPQAERLAFAEQARQASQTRQQIDGNLNVDVDVALAVHWLHAQGAQELVHGHTHRPGSGPLAPGYKRHVLSDWDLDNGSRAEVLRLTRDGFERMPPARR